MFEWPGSVRDKPLKDRAQDADMDVGARLRWR